MAGARSLVFMLAASAAAAAAPWPAAAQCRLCETPTTTNTENTVAQDVQLDVETSLDFDRLILSAASEGAAGIRPDGSGWATGSVASVGPRARFATVVVRGEAGRTLRIDVPRRIDLYSLSGGRITFDDVVTDAAELPRLDSAGNLTFHIGGRLRFMGNEEGDYRGDLPVTVEYQ